MFDLFFSKFGSPLGQENLKDIIDSVGVPYPGFEIPGMSRQHYPGRVLQCRLEQNSVSVGTASAARFLHLNSVSFLEAAVP